MKAIKYIMTMLAAIASISALGQDVASPQKAVDGYFECRAIAEAHVEDLIPSQETVDSTCYLWGANFGIIFKGNNFFDNFEQINILRLLTGLETAMEVGEPTNIYGIDEEWANRFEISPYEMNTILNNHITARNNCQSISKEATDSTCYLLGVNLGMVFRGNGFFEKSSEINIGELLAGIKDGIKAGEPKNANEEDLEWAAMFEISPYKISEFLNSFLAARQVYKKELNQKTEDYFLIVNAKREGVKKTESGLQYIIHSEGEAEKPLATDCVTTNYIGYTLDGTVFDDAEDISFELNHVIEGWQEGIKLIGKGGKITLFVPSELAYGEKGVKNAIEPCSLLVFEVELIGIEHKSNVEQE